MIRIASIAAAWLLALSAVGCTHLRETTFRPEPGADYPPRPAPAELTRRSDAELSGTGHVRVGWVSVRHTGRICLEDGYCKSYPLEPRPSAVARQVAAERGGDAIQVVVAERIVREPIRRSGDCRAWAYNPQADLPPTRNLLLPRDECIARQILHGVREIVVTEGTVWRRGDGPEP